MRRRKFLGILGCAAMTWPLVARAQQGSIPVVGFLNTASPEPFADYVQAYRDGLASTGFVEGRNVTIEYRWAEGNPSRVKEMAVDLVRRRVNVIAATGGSPAALEAKAATATIPIVFQVGLDPVKAGLVASLNRPGGNVTGATMLALDLASKRLELLRELTPGARSYAALVEPSSPGVNEIKTAADALGIRVQIVETRAERELDAAFSTIKDLQPDALYIYATPLFNGLIEKLATLSFQHRLPAIYQFRQFAAAGGLLSYGGNLSDAYHQAGVYTGRILKGDKPADLPVQQSTKVELFINLKTAKALGVTVPQTLLARADEIIE
jgi:putative tryptophan/tyrosine transport system substrate-binding protein